MDLSTLPPVPRSHTDGAFEHIERAIEEFGLSPSVKLTLLCLASYSGDYGEFAVSCSQIERDTGLRNVEVKACVSTLISLGKLRVVHPVCLSECALGRASSDCQAADDLYEVLDPADCFDDVGSPYFDIYPGNDDGDMIACSECSTFDSLVMLDWGYILKPRMCAVS